MFCVGPVPYRLMCVCAGSFLPHRGLYPWLNPRGALFASSPQDDLRSGGQRRALIRPFFAREVAGRAVL